MSNAQQDIRRKRQVLEYAQEMGNVRKACRYFGIGRSGFYRRRRIARNSLPSPSSRAPTGAPHAAHRYSYLLPVGNTSSRCSRTGRAALQRGHQSSDACNSVKERRPAM